MAQFSVNASRFDPYKNFKFRVKWDGRYVAGKPSIQPVDPPFVTDDFTRGAAEMGGWDTSAGSFANTMIAAAQAAVAAETDTAHAGISVIRHSRNHGNIRSDGMAGSADRAVNLDQRPRISKAVADDQLRP